MLFIYTDAIIRAPLRKLHFKKVTDVVNKYQLLHKHEIRKKWGHKKAAGS